MPRLSRLDTELVRRGHARSRAAAAELISEQRVRVNGVLATKAATFVRVDQAVVVGAHGGHEVQYVSRGAHKLLGALTEFDVSVSGRHCLDAGASTGGFTEVLLRSGAAYVVAVDVGYGQLAWPLRNDPRVRVLERCNVRELVAQQVGTSPELVVADLSFISLRLVLPALQGCASAQADYVLLVKPQFEVGKEQVGAKGVVRDPELRAAAVRSVAEHAQELGLGVRGIVASPLPGPSGNVEYFVWFAALSHGAEPLCSQELRRAVATGPQ